MRPLRRREAVALLYLTEQPIRSVYMTAAEVARRIGVRDSAVYLWLKGEHRPAKPELITAFLDSLTTRKGFSVDHARSSCCSAFF
jgi:hypothetical protein